MDLTMFNEEYNNRVHAEWENLINGRPVTPGIVRSEVLEVWTECMNKGINPCKKIEYELIPQEAYEALVKDNQLMCDIAEPFMKDLYDNIPGPYSFVILFDKNCSPLLGMSHNENDTASLYAQQTKTSPTPESIYGTITDTLICMKHKKPYWCYGEEHFSLEAKESLCSSAPILDDDGELLGVLTIAVDLENAHSHTMGMIISATRAIEDEMRLHKANEVTSNIASQLAATIETVPYGMLVLDNDGYINNINSCAKKILFIDNEEVTNCHVSEILVDSGNTFKKAVSFIPEQEISLKTKKGNTRYFIAAKKFSPNNKLAQDFTLIILKEHDYAKTLSNNVTNSYSRFSFSDISGSSKALADTISMAQIAARSTSTVLITGPSGTGKELFAHSIHSASDRCDGPFISINCGAFPSGLVESELFGYERGAFTGAKKEGQIGKFELANHGTIFLDEIGEMPLSAQASVLRVLESKEVTRIGGNNTIVLDVRIIAATNKDLLQAIKDKEFREDLYYRLNVLRICIPSLKERKEDIPVLTDHFLKIYTDRLNKNGITLSDDAYRMLQQYDYPGNVRELENIVERAVNICESDSVITPDILKFFLSLDHLTFEENTPESEPQQQAVTDRSNHLMKDMQKDLIIDTLKETGGSVTKTAELTGIARRTLYRKFEEYGIDYTEYRNK